jgi:hypothetical protein
MDAIEFFESESLQLPLRRDGRTEDQDFEAFLERVFSEYLAEFDNLNSSDALTQSIKDNKPAAETACKYVKTAVNQYLCGWPDSALTAFRHALVKNHFEQLMPKSDQANLEFFKALYRLRSESPHEGVRGMEFGREGLFHIPFHRRENVKRQRYSIPGLPCLYLGSSLYVCWEELGRPPLHSVYAAALQVRSQETITVLDFSQTPLAVAHSLKGVRDFGSEMPKIVARAVCWPVQAACSIRRLHREAPFIAEYIVPQLLLQWVTTSNEGRHPDYCKVDGVMYFSVNCEPDPYHPNAFLNFVFPVQKITPEGHCPVLKAKFELTHPESWELLKDCKVSARATMNALTRILVAGRTVSYQQTPFGVVEGKLNALDFLRLP